MNDRPITAAEQDIINRIPQSKDATFKLVVGEVYGTPDQFSKPLNFAHDAPAHHVLRLIAAGEISADKGAELLIAMQRGETTVLPNLTI